MKTVLIIEDNELNMQLFNDLLQAQGYNTVQNMDGKDILKLVRQHRPDLILMDVQLPGVSGMDLAKILKAEAEFKPIPVIAVTAFAMKGDEERIMEGGFDGYLSKPISIPLFLETINKFIG